MEEKLNNKLDGILANQVIIMEALEMLLAANRDVVVSSAQYLQDRLIKHTSLTKKIINPYSGG